MVWNCHCRGAVEVAGRGPMREREREQGERKERGGKKGREPNGSGKERKREGETGFQGEI